MVLGCSYNLFNIIIVLFVLFHFFMWCVCSCNPAIPSRTWWAKQLKGVVPVTVYNRHRWSVEWPSPAQPLGVRWRFRTCVGSPPDSSCTVCRFRSIWASYAHLSAVMRGHRDSRGSSSSMSTYRPGYLFLLSGFPLSAVSAVFHWLQSVRIPPCWSRELMAPKR